MAKVIVHIDLNAFFVRCEEIKDPSLEGKPVLIGHEGRSGIVSTCSYEARKYGCHSGQPMFQATKLCPKAIIIPPDYHFYSIMSNSFIAHISRYCQKIEQVSIDECFLDMSESLKGVEDVEGYFKSIQKSLFEATGLKCSIGVSITKWLAKMGSDMKKPLGLTIIRKKDIPNIIFPLPIESFWGIGRHSSPRLKEIGINTIGDLYKRIIDDEDNMSKFFGKMFIDVKSALEGKSSNNVHTEREDPKSIGNSETMMEDKVGEDSIAPYIRSLSYEVSQRTKREGVFGKTITLQVKDIEFKTHNRSLTIDDATNNAEVIYGKCLELFRENFSSMEIRLVGVTLSKLSNPQKETVQMSLWNYEEYEEMDKTKLLINDFNNKSGKKLFKRASDLKKEE